MRGATAIKGPGSVDYGIFQPTRPLRGATVPFGYIAVTHFEISTHAPLAGRDFVHNSRMVATSISTHAPLAGRDHFAGNVYVLQDISTHAPLAGRDKESQKQVLHVRISTHAPLAGRDR